MADPVAAIAIAIPLIAVAGFSMFLVVNRTKFLVLRGRLMDALLGGLVVLLGGLSVVFAGFVYSDAGLTNVGLAVAGLSMGTLCALAVPLLRQQERERGQLERVSVAAEQASAQAHAIVRAAEAAGIGVMVAEARPEGGDAVVSLNAQAASLAGRDQAAVLGLSVADLVIHDDRS